MVKSDSTSINSYLVRKLTALLLIVAVILSVCSCRKSDSDFDVLCHGFGSFPNSASRQFRGG